MAAVSKTRFVIKTINKISPAGLARFGGDKYTITPSEENPEIAHAIMLRSHKMQDSDVPLTTRAIARYVDARPSPKSPEKKSETRAPPNEKATKPFEPVGAARARTTATCRA